MQLLIVHYHLLPGGVTDVIVRMVEALRRRPGPVTAITLLCGSDENLAAVRSRLDSASGEAIPLRCEVVPEIGYLSRLRITRPRGSEQAEGGEPIGQVRDADVRAGADELAPRLARMLRERFCGPDVVWWVHNHHLGKNPVFTRALFQIAAEGAARVVFHIHDFPECGRYANLHELHAAGIDELYPRFAGTRYVTINSRDRTLLQRAGIADAEYLPNPVPPQARGEAADPGAVRDALGHAFGTRFPMFDPQRPLLLYPVRTIRRKNVLEAALLTAIAGVRPSLVVTLPGVSRAEQPYSALVERAFAEGVVAGLWGIGAGLEGAGVTFPQLVAAADAFISSSVQEGFGFQFITPLVEGAPLVARRLPVFADVEPLYDGAPGAIYDRVTVPWSTPTLSDPRAYLRFRYEERLQRITPRLPQRAVAALEEELEQLLAADAVDLSYLPPQMQYAHLRSCAMDDAYRADVVALNAALVSAVDGAATTPMPQRAAAVEERFGYDAVAARIGSILARLDAPVPDAPGGVEATLLEHFATLDYQRLLYEEHG